MKLMRHVVLLTAFLGSLGIIGMTSAAELPSLSETKSTASAANVKEAHSASSWPISIILNASMTNTDMA